MMQSEDDGDDERCLLSNKRRLEKDQEEDLETETDDSWRIWVISTTCLVLGFALGAFWVGGSQALEPTTPSDAAAGGLGSFPFSLTGEKGVVTDGGMTD